MKTITFFLFCLLSNKLISQFTITSFSINTINLESGDLVSSEDRLETYNISFKDNLVIHNIFDSETNSVINSQIYKIVSIKEDSDMTYFTVESGLSGNNYSYIIKIGEEQTQLFQYFDEEEVIEYKGNSSGLNTFNQD